MRLTLHTFLTLDGVMQAPGGPDEDPAGGFAHGGWSFPYGDEDFGAAMVGWFGHASAFLLGRKTYEIFSGHWPRGHRPRRPDRGQAQRAAEVRRLHHARHPRTGTTPSLLGGDVAAEVAKLKELPGDELQVHGSGDLAQTLIEHDLIDEYRLLYFPVHLGSGKKLFARRRQGGGPAADQHLGHRDRRHHRHLRAGGPAAVRLVRAAQRVVTITRHAGCSVRSSLRTESKRRLREKPEPIFIYKICGGLYAESGGQSGQLTRPNYPS